MPIGPYVADFACLRARLIIELDGGHHSQDDVAANDETRTRWLESEGYRVVRFTYRRVVDQPAAVAAALRALLACERPT